MRILGQLLFVSRPKKELTKKMVNCVNQDWVAKRIGTLSINLFSMVDLWSLKGQLNVPACAF
jgi:hypothetical protein